jgi:hypothetical protein
MLSKMIVRPEIIILRKFHNRKTEKKRRILKFKSQLHLRNSVKTATVNQLDNHSNFIPRKTNRNSLTDKRSLFTANYRNTLFKFKLETFTRFSWKETLEMYPKTCRTFKFSVGTYSEVA